MSVLPPESRLLQRLGPYGKLAMASVASVPAGKYGKAAWTYLGLWDAVAPRVAQAENVRAAPLVGVLTSTPSSTRRHTHAEALGDPPRRLFTSRRDGF